MKAAKYIREPGYIADLILIYALYFNKELILKNDLSESFVQLNVIEHFNKISNHFGVIDDDFLPFFHVKGSIESFMMSEVYDDPSLFSDFNFDHMYNNLSDKERLKNKLVRFYFETDNGFSSHSIQELAEKAQALDIRIM